MTSFLLVALILIDVGLLVAVFLLGRRQEAHIELVEELTEERRLLTELRSSVQEELEAAQKKSRDMVDKVSRLATEAEQEVKSGGQKITQELESAASQLTGKLEQPLKDLTRKQNHVENLLRQVERQKSILNKLITRGEKICRFFDQRVPYEEVLHEIEDKKYVDARSLLAKGESPAAVARELGMNESEVRLVAGMTGR